MRFCCERMGIQLETNQSINSLSEEDYDLLVKTRKRADGKIYYSPGAGRQGKTRMRAWLYREDIFKKHNLETPKTFDEIAVS